MKFLDIFEPIIKGNFGLTEEAIYKSLQLGNKTIPLWGGNKEHIYADRFVDEKAKTKYNEPITIFNEEGIIISLDGSAGNMTYKKDECFALNHHAGFFKVKNHNLIVPEFFSIFYQQQLCEAAISEGSKTLNLDTIYSLDFVIPSKLTQQKLMDEMNSVHDCRYRINKLNRRITLIKNKTFSLGFKNFQVQNIPIIDVLGCLSGNSGLTEKEIYQSVCSQGDKYRILSSSTSNETELGKVPLFYLNGKLIKVFEDKEGILVSRNGKAGSIKYLDKGKYTLTDHAYILYLRDDCQYNVLIKWIAIQYANIFLEYTSSSDNATWDMTGFFNNELN